MVFPRAPRHDDLDTSPRRRLPRIGAYPLPPAPDGTILGEAPARLAECIS